MESSASRPGATARKGVSPSARGAVGGEASALVSAETPVAFVGHASACEALRTLGADESRWRSLLPTAWPPDARKLPKDGACVSNQRAFRRLCADTGLADLGILSRPVDLLVPCSGMRSRGRDVRFHVWSRALPPRSMLRAAEGLLVSRPELVIIQLCGAQAKLEGLLDDFGERVRAIQEYRLELGMEEPAVEELPTAWESRRRVVAAAALICEFAGTYRLPRVAGQAASYQAPRLMSLGSLQSVLDQTDAGPEARRVEQAVGLALEGSASPMETTLALMLTMPLEYGGFGLPKPRLNSPVDVSGAPSGLSSGRGAVRPDMLWPEAKIALEYDSTAFHGRPGLSRLAADASRSNVLASMGYTVFRVTPGMLRTLSDMGRLARQVADRLGTALEQPTDLEELRRERIFVDLMPRRG